MADGGEDMRKAWRWRRKDERGRVCVRFARGLWRGVELEWGGGSLRFAWTLRRVAELGGISSEASSKPPSRVGELVQIASPGGKVPWLQPYGIRTGAIGVTEKPSSKKQERRCTMQEVR